MSVRPAGKWTDDLIRLRQGHASLKDALAEARAFLALPPPKPKPQTKTSREPAHAAQRLFHAAQPITGTLAAAYLAHRGLAASADIRTLRFHPCCYHRADGVTRALPRAAGGVSRPRKSHH